MSLNPNTINQNTLTELTSVIIFTKICLYNFEPLKPHFYVLSRSMKNIKVFLYENFPFLEVKFYIFLNRRVFVMWSAKHNSRRYLAGDAWTWDEKTDRPTSHRKCPDSQSKTAESITSDMVTKSERNSRIIHCKWRYPRNGTITKLALPRHQKKERWGTNNDKTNVTYESTDSRTKKNCNRALRKHAYSNILKNLPPKKWNFSDKNSDIFFIFLLKTLIVDTS